MKTKWLPVAVAVVSALSAQAAVSAEAAGFDYYGYFRSGMGTGDSGSMQDAVGAASRRTRSAVWATNSIPMPRWVSARS